MHRRPALQVLQQGAGRGAGLWRQLGERVRGQKRQEGLRVTSRPEQGVYFIFVLLLVLALVTYVPVVGMGLVDFFYR